MDDPGKFATLTEYHVLMYALEILILSEFIIMCLAFRGSRGPRRRADRGTKWLIILAWCFSITAGAYFRSQSMPEFIRGWLLPHFCYYIGIVFILAGIVIRYAAVFTLKKAFTLSVQTTSDQHLITTGLYQVVRNPAYTGSILSVLGAALAYRHILGIISAFVLCLVCYGIRISVEETALRTQFNKEFEQYCAETRFRLIPGIY